MVTKEYKLTIIKIIKFTIVFLIVDFVLGIISNQLFYSQETGKYARSTHAVEKTNAEIIVFGSSHAHRHYVPKIFEKELGKTCYNAGAEGQQLLYHTALQEMILKRVKPKLIVLNIDENFLYTSKQAYDRLSDLHPYYAGHSKELSAILGLKSRFIDFKLFFKSYQMNSTIVHALRYYVSPQLDYHGYRPLYGKINPNKVNSHTKEEVKEYVELIDDNFVEVVEKFIDNARNNGCELVFVTSPTFNKVNHDKNKSFIRIKEIIATKKVPFIDFFNSSDFNGKSELFHDFSHLNNDGAELFTKQLTKKIMDMNLINYNKKMIE